MLTYITMDISLCPTEWYQSAKFRVLAHALKCLQFRQNNVDSVQNFINLCLNWKVSVVSNILNL